MSYCPECAKLEQENRRLREAVKMLRQGMLDGAPGNAEYTRDDGKPLSERAHWWRYVATHVLAATAEWEQP